MSLSTFKPAAFGVPPAAAGANGSHSKLSKVRMMSSRQPLLPLKAMKEKENVAFDRREMLELTAASVGLISLLLPAPAEARPRNATMRQKIMEKFEELRQKTGLSKPKDESEENKPKEDKSTTKETKPKMKEGGEDEKSKAKPHHSALPQSEGPSLPALPSILNGKTVNQSPLIEISP